MSKRILYIFGGIIFALLAIIGFQQYRLYQTKQYSPEATVQYTNSNVSIKVTYSRPSKKGREIFGALVPYGQWWRTGANEPTLIELSRDISFGGTNTLKAGNYSIVTVPGEEEWVVVFNNKIPDWGTDYSPEHDAIRVKGRVETLPDVVELFTIDFTDEDGVPSMIMAWDKTKVSIPFRVL